jgi:hypothetical protein
LDKQPAHTDLIGNRDRRLSLAPGRISSVSSRLGRWRRLAFVLLALACCCQSGCQVFRSFRDGPEPLPVVFNQPPSQQQLMDALNARVQTIEQLQSNISLEAKGMPKLKGVLQVERPDRLRLKAGLMGVSDLGIDVGSNAEQFWVWSKAALPGHSPAIYFASHRELQQSPNRPAIPIDPQWIFDAMGLSTFGKNEFVQGPFVGPNQMVILLATRQTSAGPVVRRTVLNPLTASIYQQAIYDSNNRLIAYSNSLNHRRYEDPAVSLPHRIELFVFDSSQNSNRMVVEMGEYKINSLYGDPDKMWTMPNAEGVPRVNLATAGSKSPSY